MNNNNRHSTTSLPARIRSAALASDLPWRRITSAFLCVIASAVLAGASLFGGVRPFALAFLAAADGFTMSAAALAGSVMGAAAQPDFVASALASAILFLVRIGIGVWIRREERDESPSGGAFSSLCRAAVLRGATEHVWLRAAFASAAAMIAGAISLVSRQLTARAVLSVFASAIIAPAAALAFSTLTVRNLARTHARDAGVCVLLFAFVRAMRDVAGLSLHFGIIAAFSLSILAARGIRFGHASPASDASRVMWGVLCGVITGLAVDPGGAPLYAAAALAAGILFPVSAGLAAAAGWLCAVGISFAAGGLAALSAAVPELTISAAILVPLLQFGIIPAPAVSPPLSESHGAAVTEARLAREQSDFSVSRMRSLAAALSSLAETVGGLSKKLARPPLAQLKQITESAFDAECAGCRNRILCRERECASYSDMICRLSMAMHKSGKADAGVIPQALAARCHRIDDILAEAEAGCAQAARQAREQDHSEAFAEDFQSFAQILTDAAAETEEKYAPDEGMSARVKREMAAMDMGAVSVTVSGTRRRTLRAHDLDLSRLRLGNEDIRRAMEGILGCPLSTPEYEIDGERISMRMDSLPRFTLIDGCGGRTAGEMRGTRAPGGDYASSFESDDGRYYMVICDGMGTGSEASVTARTAAAFLEETLRGGAQMQAALVMLNSYLRRRSMECSAGIDLMEIDRYTGEAKFVKSGAAPSFVIRGGRLFRLCSKTVPIGILRALDAEMIRFTLEKGDVIVMVSDGVSENPEDAAWLCDMLASPSASSDEPADLAQKIIRAACAVAGRRDDATAAVVKVG